MASTDAGAPWLATMREIAGVKEYAGGENNPTILGWARFIGLTYPEMSAYADGYKHDSIPWCGLTMAYVLAKNGVKPPFGDGDLQRFLWANSFAGWGIKLVQPRAGAVVVFRWPQGGGHVGILDRIEGRTIYVAGGNQSDAVTIAPFSWDESVVGFFWPDAVAAAAAPERTPADVRRRMGKAITLAEARRDAQGRLAVYHLPTGDGGGAYEVAGINERYHPVAAAKLKALIETGRHQEAEDFVGDYTGSYTDVADVWTSSWGVEFYLRDCVFNRGPTGAALIMQLALKALGENLGESGNLRDGVDGDVGPLTADAMRRQEADTLRFLQALRAAREVYERAGNQYISGGPHRDESSQFWRGLINRFNNALTVARRFHDEQPKESTPVADPNAPVVNADLAAILAAVRENNAQIADLIRTLRGTTAPPVVTRPPATEPEPPAVTKPPATELPVVPPAVVVAPAPTPILEKPGMGLAATGLGLSALLQWFGGIDVTEGGSLGQLLPIASGFLGLLSGTGTIGTVLNALSTVGGIIGRARQPAK